MEGPLAGRVILIVEDEPLVALDIQDTFEAAGARVILAPTVAAALVAIQEPGLSAAIVDHALGDGDSSEICDRLKHLNVPFVTYSGYTHVDGACADAVHVAKPATPHMLLATVKGVLAGQPTAD
jgi:DNA-binding response OmpR family regulator